MLPVLLHCFPEPRPPRPDHAWRDNSVSRRHHRGMRESLPGRKRNRGMAKHRSLKTVSARPEMAPGLRQAGRALRAMRPREGNDLFVPGGDRHDKRVGAVLRRRAVALSAPLLHPAMRRRGAPHHRAGCRQRVARKEKALIFRPP